ncbi:MAG: magnesium chelatase [Planctomycetaceae bacterium]|nr:magnesium chelatase [Planctomycetaceae bacterium]
MDPTLQRIRDNIRTVIRGKDDRVDLLIAAMLAGGHVLIEDLPGVGKTTLAKALALSIDGKFRRIQFTPDLLPTDVLGGSIYNPQTGAFTFHQGPIFANILLSDEINRASPRTQSSLLEAMAERQATIEGTSYPLPELFMVIATQNPVEFHGTYPLPEAQLDRFLIRMDLGYATPADEQSILFEQNLTHPIDTLQPVTDCDQITALQHKVRQVHVAEELGAYIVDLVVATRDHARMEIGASPRGALGLFRMAQAVALIDSRDHIMPEDIQQIAVPVLAHRVMLETKARHSGLDKPTMIKEVIQSVRVPR